MKVIATLEENKAVQVERINEKGMVIGMRQVASIDFAKSFLHEIPYGELFEYLAKTNFKDYFSSFGYAEKKVFADFLTTLVNSVGDKTWLLESDLLKELANTAAIRLNAISPLQEHHEGTNFFKVWLQQLLSLPYDEHLEELMVLLFNKALQGRKPEYQKVFRSLLHQISLQIPKTDEEIKRIQHEFENVSEFVPLQVLHEIYEQRLIKSQDRIVRTTNSIPKNCVYMGTGANHSSFVFEIPKSAIRVKYQNVAYENVGHPRLLSIVRVHQNKIENLALFAVKEHAAIHDDMELYKYPFAHVYGSGDVCWNGYKAIPVEQMHMLTDMFLSTSNSNHLNTQVREIYEGLSGKEFDDSVLKPMNITLKSVL